MIRSVILSAYSYERADTRQSACARLWAFGLPLLLFPVFTFILATLLFVSGGALSSIAAWWILCASLAGAVFLPRFFFPTEWRLAAVFAVSAGVLALLLSLLVHDTSIDGQHYHFQAVYAFAEGWNPLTGEGEPPVIGDPMTLWALHYTRGGWVFSATLLAAGLPLAAMKTINFLILFATAAMLAGTFIRFGFSALFAALLTAAAVLNPVITSQSLTAMNDGLFGLCILLFTGSMAIWVRYDETPALVAGLATMILAVNLKFSAVPIFFVLSAFACFAAFAVRGPRDMVKIAAALLGAAFIGVILLGWSPYVQNYLGFGHPFYPLMGENAVDIMNGADPELENTPKVLEHLPAFQRFLFSLFSETHSGYATAANLKIPFSITPAELRAAGGVDIRLGGFGPFFSGAVLLALAGLVAIALSPGRRNPVTIGLLFISAALLVSVLVMPQNWWARYVPQFWFVPLCAAAAAMTVQRLPVQILGGLIAIILLLNASLSAASGLWLSAKRSAAVEDQLDSMRRSKQTYCIQPEMVQSRLYLMREAGIRVQYMAPSALVCAEPEEIAGYGPDRHGGKICVCPGDDPR